MPDRLSLPSTRAKSRTRRQGRIPVATVSVLVGVATIAGLLLGNSFTNDTTARTAEPSSGALVLTLLLVAAGIVFILGAIAGLQLRRRWRSAPAAVDESDDARMAEPVAEAEPVIEPEPAAEAEPVAEPEPVAEAKPALQARDSHTKPRRQPARKPGRSPGRPKNKRQASAVPVDNPPPAADPNASVRKSA